MDIRDYNRDAWDRRVEQADRWTVPASSEAVRAARQGAWSIVLTPTKPVPRSWFPQLTGLEVLCLASGGGQQGPVLAAAGASVTVLDNSPRQLAQDQLVADREGLTLETAEGDMADLSRFPSERFGLVVHPVSNCFVPDVRPVWREVFRVLRPGGVLLAEFANPVMFIFDDVKQEQGVLEVRHRVPYSDVTSLSEQERRRYLDRGEPLMFGHTLEDQIGGQLDVGLVLTGLYEDTDPGHALSSFHPTYMATRAVKP